MQAGDVPATYAKTDGLRQAIGFKHTTPIERALGKFVKWYQNYFG